MRYSLANMKNEQANSNSRKGSKMTISDAIRTALQSNVTGDHGDTALNLADQIALSEGHNAGSVNHSNRVRDIQLDIVEGVAGISKDASDIAVDDGLTRGTD